MSVPLKKDKEKAVIKQKEKEKKITVEQYFNVKPAPPPEGAEGDLSAYVDKFISKTPYQELVKVTQKDPDRIFNPIKEVK